MVGIYFSGSGNTKYCINEFVKHYDQSVKIYSIEDNDAINAIINNKKIIFAYPIQFSNIPYIIENFIKNNKEIFKNKEIYIIATMGLFSGDGTGCSARLFKKYHAKIIGGLHLKMPDSISDVKLLKRTYDKNVAIIKKTNQKIKDAVHKLKNNQKSRDGLGFINHLVGLFGQRLYFYNARKKHINDLKIDESKCITCGICTKICPVNNLEIVDGKVIVKNNCTMCYRCVNSCPKEAITLLGDKVIKQHSIKEYL